MVFSPRNLINGTACSEVVKMIRPSAPLWIGSPVQTSPHSWEFLIAEASQIKQWDDCRHDLALYFVDKSYGVGAAGRIYGCNYRQSIMTVVICSSHEFSADEQREIRTICDGIKVLFVLEAPRASNGGTHARGIHCQYEKQLSNGISIGPEGERSAGSFGGYIKLNGQLYGLTCSHVLVTNATRIDLSDKPQLTSPVAQSPAQIDLNDYIDQLKKEKEQLEAKMGNPLSAAERDQKSHLNNQITFNKGLTVGDLQVGRVRASSGERFDREENSLTNDWALFDIVKERIGRNAFPATHLFPSTPPHPSTRPGRLYQAFWRDDGTAVIQEIVYRGRTSGLTRGYTRSLKTLVVDWWGDVNKKALIHGYSFAIRTSEFVGYPHFRPGDSGSWIWDVKTGQPVAQVTWIIYGEAVGISLEGVFDEIEEYTGFTPRIC